MTIRRRLRSLIWRVPVEQEVRDELAHHVELRTRELVDRGVDPVHARDNRHWRGSAMSPKWKPASAGLALDRDRAFARQDWWDEFRQDVRFALPASRNDSPDSRPPPS